MVSYGGDIGWQLRTTKHHATRYVHRTKDATFDESWATSGMAARTFKKHMPTDSFLDSLGQLSFDIFPAVIAAFGSRT
jgi:hypothetical protein